MNTQRPIIESNASRSVPEALTRLGRSVKYKELHGFEREIDRNIDCCERLVGQMPELMAEVGDDAIPDYAQTLATHKLTAARNEYDTRIEKVIVLLGKTAALRDQLGLPGNVLVDLCDRMARVRA